MKKYILDASLVLSFLLEEKQSVKKEFTKILRQVQAGKSKLIASHLLPLEVGNGLRFTLRNKELAGEVFEKFLSLPISLFPLKNPHYEKILKLGFLLETSFYDTSYHFLAQLLGGTFLTCDKAYFQKAKHLKSIKLF